MQSAPPQPAQLSELAGTLRRRWRVLALGAVVGVLLGVLAWVLLPVTYTATTSVRVVPVDVSPSSGSSPTLDVATDAQLVTSGDVLTAAADDLDTSAGALRRGVSVTNPPDTAVLDIAYTASTPRTAAAGSRAVAEAFLTVRGEAAATTVQELQEATWDRIDMLEDSADRYPKDSPARESILTEAKTLGTRAAELATVDTSPGRVLGAPATPSAPSSLGVLPLGVAGLALGLLVGVLVDERLGLGVHLLDELLEPGRLDPPLAASADLDRRQLPASHQRVDLRARGVEHLRHVGEREEAGSGGHGSIVSPPVPSAGATRAGCG